MAFAESRHFPRGSFRCRMKNATFLSIGVRRLRRLRRPPDQIPDETERPAALLEFLGRGPRGAPFSTSPVAGSLTPREAAAACRCAATLLVALPEGGKAEEVHDGGPAGEGPAGGGEDGPSGDEASAAVGPDAEEGGLAFPLDIDQEVGSATILFGSWLRVCARDQGRLGGPPSLGNVSGQKDAEGGTPAS